MAVAPFAGGALLGIVPQATSFEDVAKLFADHQKNFEQKLQDAASVQFIIFARARAPALSSFILVPLP